MLKKILFVLLMIMIIPAQRCFALSSSELIPILTTDFSDGTVNPWGIQANPGDITVVTDPLDATKKAMKATMNINEDFSNVANGAPRAEIAYTKQQLVNDTTYVIMFRTYLPKDFQMESTYSSPHAFFQVHQNIPGGSPQLSLQIDKNQYRMTSNSSESSPSQYAPVIKTIGTINGDLGKWTDWTILYKPSYSTTGQVVVWKNGALVLNYAGVCAYKGLTGYLKFGLYKSAWKTSPTTISNITTYFSNIQILQRK